MIQYYYAIGPVERHESKEEGVWYGPPTDCVGWIDTRPCENAEGTGFFAFHYRPRHLGVAYTIIGDGRPLDVYFPNLTERSAWETLYGVKVASTDTLLEMLVHLLTEQADAEGVERCRPLTLNHLGEYEIHLGGHSRIFRAKFQGEKDRLWPNLQRLWQSELRKTHTAEAKRGIDPDVQVGKMLAELARLHRCPVVELTPKVLKGLKPRKPTTRLYDDFNRADGELSVAGNATYGGVDQGWGWAKVSNLTDNFAITSSQVKFLELVTDRWCLYAHDIPLSSPNTTTNVLNYSPLGSVGARQSVATPGSGALCYVSRVNKLLGNLNIYLVTDRSYTKLTTGVGIPSGLGYQNHIICDGSSITAMYVLGDMYSNTVTNTVLASGQYTGIVGRGNVIVDNFVTADLLFSQTPGTLFSEGAL